MSAKPDRFLTASDVAEELHVSTRTAYRIMKMIPHVVHGRIVRVSRVAWEAYLRASEVEAWQTKGFTGAVGCWYYENGKLIRASTKQRDKDAARLTLRQFERTAADPRHAAENKTTIDSALRRMIANRRWP